MAGTVPVDFQPGGLLPPTGSDTTITPLITGIPQPDPALANDAESWVGWAVAALVVALVVAIVAPAILPIVMIAAAIVAVVAVAKVTTALVDYVTGKLGLNPTAPLPRLIAQWSWIVWLILAILAVVLYLKRGKTR